MLSLENKEWKAFSISEIFNKIYIAKSQDFGKMKKGKTPFVGRAAINNGFQDMVDSKIEEEGNCISIGMVSTTFRAFYRDVNFACSQNILILRMNQLTRNKALFLNSIFNSTILLIFSYGKPIKLANFKKQKILLPVNEKSEPDYEYMEEYIKSKIDKKLEEYKKYANKVLANLEYKEIEPLENKEWKEFYLSGEKGIFTNYHGKRLIKEHRILGLTPLLTACENNNGISSFISNETMNKYKNCITIDMFGNSFYHNYFCSGDDNIYFFLNDDLCMFKKLFIVEMINKNKNKFSYGKQFRQKNADNFKILLPINEKNEPDYEYMEQYSKNLMYKKIKQYLDYKNKEA